VSSAVAFASAFAVGTSFASAMVIVTVARFEFSAPSLARYVKLSLPLTFAAGV
jgi:hypothetical protein